MNVGDRVFPRARRPGWFWVRVRPPGDLVAPKPVTALDTIDETLKPWTTWRPRHVMMEYRSFTPGHQVNGVWRPYGLELCVRFETRNRELEQVVAVDDDRLEWGSYVIARPKMEAP